MAMQNLKTVVTLGGTVDGSFNKIGSAFNESMGKATKTVKELEREQGKLTKEIRKSKLAGADVSLLTRRYQQLGNEINDAKEQAEAFESASGIGSKLRGVASAGAVAVGSIWAVTTATAGLMTVTNQQTAEMAGMAKAYDMSIDKFAQWGGVAQQAGLNAENVGDLIEELSNKFGEFKALGKQSSVSDAFGALGINKAMLEGKTATEQFEFIMKRLESVTDKQQAASLADMLMGGEANKLTTYIRNTGKSLNDLLGEQKQFNLLTNEGATGAVSYGKSFKNLTTVISSAWQEISGIVGGEMAADIQQLGSTVSKYVKENKEEVVGTLKSLVYGAKDFAVAIWNVGSAVNGVAQSMGGWQVIGTAIASLMAAKLVVGMASFVATGFQVVKAIGLMKTGMAGFNVVMAANPIGLVVAAVGALIFAGIQLYQNWDAVTAWFSGKLTWFKTEFPATFNFIKTLFDWSPLGLIVNHWEPITGFFSDMWGGITGIFDAGLSKVTGIWDTVSGWMDKLKFWDGDSPAPEVKSYHQVQQEQRTSRAMTAINGSYPASRGTTVNQKVGEIKVIAAPGQSPQEVAMAVHSQLGGYQSSALYDLPEAG